MDNKDRELQIELAKLQTDVQINLTISVSLMAVFFALIISFQQLLINATDPFQQFSFTLGMVGSVLFAITSLKFFIKKMYDKREEMEQLKKDYVF